MDIGTFYEEKSYLSKDFVKKKKEGGNIVGGRTLVVDNGSFIVKK